ncbi:SpaH/EbpB family LPXTG-anchored major pilin [Coprococcus catus]|uniref:SpaH/EbpB family LPXTG-anchored major pilin n=1 Tax=Coprococcus catus TaxID=116085 RepID=UPI003CFECFCB
MKQAKKFASFLLALVMVFAMATTAFAAGTNSITVNDAQKGETYKLYKMLDLSVNEANTAYSYTVNSDWDDFFTTGAGKDYVDIDIQGYVTWKESKKDAVSMEAFGKAAAAAVSGKTVVATETPTADGSFTFLNLDAGYYLITSTNGNLAIVDTTPTNPAATVNEKNVDHTLDKKVQEDSQAEAEGNGWGKSNSAQIGDTVNFQTTITLKKGAKNVVMHDKMGNGLTFSGANRVAIAGLTKGTDYTVVTTGLYDECDFEIQFTQTYLDSLTADTTLTVTYSAVLNKDADITAGEKNDAKLTWGDASNTEWSETVTKTYQFEVLKYAANDKEKSPLAGATFQLQDANGNVVKLIKVSDTVYRVANGDETGAVDSFTTVASGKIVIKGVDLDEYTLVETAAPAGYNKLKDPVDVTVLNTNALTVEVSNATGTELPSTGGMGTTIFYVVGAILVISAAVLLVTRKRMSNRR